MAVHVRKNARGATHTAKSQINVVPRHDANQAARFEPHSSDPLIFAKQTTRPESVPTAPHERPVLVRDKPHTLLLADDHPVVREGIAAVLNRQPDLKVVAQASTGKDAVGQYLEHRPQIALLDLRMPSGDGIEAVQAICAKAPDAQLIILTTYQDEEDVYLSLQAGAKGYVLKSAPVEEILACVRAVANGGTWVPPIVGATLAKRVSTRALTSRETEVLQWMSIGKSNKEIGVALGITEATVKVHMTHILEKLGVSGRTEAIGVALKRGLIRVEANMAARA